MKTIFCSILLLLITATLALGQAPTPSVATPAHSFVPATGEQAARREKLMEHLTHDPYPKGSWGLVGQSLASYWLGANVAGDNAMIAAQKDRAEKESEEGGFHWRAYQIDRIVLLFGRKGTFAPGRMSPDAEKAAKEMLWAWLEPRARKSLVDPVRDWMLWKSENHHLQAWSSMWGALTIFATDPDYANRKFADGSSVSELKPAFDEYYKRWIRLRAATGGMFVETGSPTYSKYSISGFYNLVDFAADPELKRLAHEFLDLYWTQWALEQIDGVRGGSRHRSYPGASSVHDGGADEVAWYHFGLGHGESLHPAVWCPATSGYTPPEIVSAIASRRRELGEYEITSRQPGLAAHNASESIYGSEPNSSIKGGYILDPECRSLLRRTFAAPEFVLGTSMVAALQQEAWTAISAQNRWDGLLFSGQGSPRIFVQPAKPSKGSIYNTEWSVQDRGVLLIQRLPYTTAKGQRMFFSESLAPKEHDGWIFVETPGALAAVKVVDGAWKWEPDSADNWHEPRQFHAGEGRWLVPDNEYTPLIMEVVSKKAGTEMEDFQREILGNGLKRATNRIDYTSRHYQTTLTLFTNFRQTPLINNKPLVYESPLAFDSPLLQENFKSGTAHLKAFGQEHTFTFAGK